MIIAFRADVEILLNGVFIDHLLAAAASQPQALGHILSRLEGKAVPF
jgi:hypothetical protein